jgi:hypothetical protein
MIHYSRWPEVTHRPDVLVCGGGLAGIGAALAPGRGVGTRGVPIRELPDRIVGQGGLLDTAGRAATA